MNDLPKSSADQVAMALNAIANDQLLDNADHEYVGARNDYQIGLRQQYYWHALHALEKYFKCILLFNRNDPNSQIGNGKKLRNYQHDLVKLCEDCDKLSKINFKLSDECRVFIEHLNMPSRGPNRYLSHSTTMGIHSLEQLDCAVWEIRTWAQNAPAHIAFIESQSGKPFDEPLNYCSKVGHRQLSMTHLLERLQDKSVSPHLDGQAKALLVGNAYYIPIGGEPVPAEHHFSSSFVAITDREWAATTEVREAIKRYIE